jgi:uncharacterized phage protein (TIGR01671 family)
MREIKFRHWSESQKQMIQVHSLDFINAHGAMQYTGLTDKNGKEIFQSDIASFRGMCSVVKFGFYVDVRSCCEDVTGNGFYLDIIEARCKIALDEETAKECEITANEYENPELLNATK